MLIADILQEISWKAEPRFCIRGYCELCGAGKKLAPDQKYGEEPRIQTHTSACMFYRSSEACGASKEILNLIRANVE